MGLYADIKTQLEEKIAYYQELKENLLAIKDDTSHVSRWGYGYTTTSDTGLRGFTDNWRTDNPTSDGSASANDQELYNLWQFCQSKTDDELYALAPHYDTIIAELNTDLAHIQKIVDNGEDPAGVMES